MVLQEQESHEILEPISKDPLRLDAWDLKMLWNFRRNFLIKITPNLVI